MIHRRLKLFLAVLSTAFLAVFASVGPASAATSTTTGPLAGVQVSTHGDTETVTYHSFKITMKATGVAKPQIQVASCSGRPNWVHLYTSTGDICFGFTGTAYLTYNDSYGYCWGNNYGTIKWNWLSNGDLDFTSVTINGWSGNATCPL